MSETGIENEKSYAERTNRVDAGVGLLAWMVVYAAAVVVLLLDLLVWRPN